MDREFKIGREEKLALIHVFLQFTLQVTHMYFSSFYITLSKFLYNKNQYNIVRFKMFQIIPMQLSK